MGLIDGILNFGGKIMGKVWPDRAASREQQSQINQAEISGAPTSKLRLWRSLLGCGLTVAFLWEVRAGAAAEMLPELRGSDDPLQRQKKIRHVEGEAFAGNRVGERTVPHTVNRDGRPLDAVLRVGHKSAKDLKDSGKFLK